MKKIQVHKSINPDKDEGGSFGQCVMAYEVQTKIKVVEDLIYNIYRWRNTILPT